MLFWNTVTSSYRPNYYTKGTVLSVAYVPGTLARFAVEEVRAYDAEGQPTTVYRVRDAETITDEEIVAGKLPAIVYRADDPDTCVEWVRKQGE